MSASSGAHTASTSMTAPSAIDSAAHDTPTTSVPPPFYTAPLPPRQRLQWMAATPEQRHVGGGRVCTEEQRLCASSTTSAGRTAAPSAESGTAGDQGDRFPTEPADSGVEQVRQSSMACTSPHNADYRGECDDGGGRNEAHATTHSTENRPMDCTHDLLDAQMSSRSVQSRHRCQDGESMAERTNLDTDGTARSAVSDLLSTSQRTPDVAIATEGEQKRGCGQSMRQASNAAQPDASMGMQAGPKSDAEMQSQRSAIRTDALQPPKPSTPPRQPTMPPTDIHLGTAVAADSQCVTRNPTEASEHLWLGHPISVGHHLSGPNSVAAEASGCLSQCQSQPRTYGSIRVAIEQQGGKHACSTLGTEQDGGTDEPSPSCVPFTISPNSLNEHSPKEGPEAFYPISIHRTPYYECSTAFLPLPLHPTDDDHTFVPPLPLFSPQRPYRLPTPPPLPPLSSRSQSNRASVPRDHQRRSPHPGPRSRCDNDISTQIQAGVGQRQRSNTTGTKGNLARGKLQRLQPPLYRATHSMRPGTFQAVRGKQTAKDRDRALLEQRSTSRGANLRVEQDRSSESDRRVLHSLRLIESMDMGSDRVGDEEMLNRDLRASIRFNPPRTRTKPKQKGAPAGDTNVHLRGRFCSAVHSDGAKTVTKRAQQGNFEQGNFDDSSTPSTANASPPHHSSPARETATLKAPPARTRISIACDPCRAFK